MKWSSPKGSPGTTAIPASSMRYVARSTEPFIVLSLYFLPKSFETLGKT